jgi:adenylate cyclase
LQLNPDVVIVAIREETLQQFPYRAPVNRKFISELLQKIASEHPRAIGVDLLFDQPTEEINDAMLKDTLRRIDIPLVVSYVQIETVVLDEQKAYLEEFVPKKLRGFANVQTDQFDVVREIYPGEETKDGYVQGFARAIAGALGVKTDARRVPVVLH